METFVSLFSKIDIKYVYIAIAIIVVLGIITIVKKAVKLGIIILIIALVLTYGGTAVSKLKEQYQVQVNGTEFSMVIYDKPVSINLLDIKEIVVQESNSDKVKLKIIGTGENQKGTDVEVPKLLFNLLRGQANKYDIKIREESK